MGSNTGEGMDNGASIGKLNELVHLKIIKEFDSEEQRLRFELGVLFLEFDNFSPGQELSEKQIPYLEKFGEEISKLGFALSTCNISETVEYILRIGNETIDANPTSTYSTLYVSLVSDIGLIRRYSKKISGNDIKFLGEKISRKARIIMNFLGSIENVNQ